MNLFNLVNIAVYEKVLLCNVVGCCVGCGFS